MEHKRYGISSGLLLLTTLLSFLISFSVDAATFTTTYLAVYNTYPQSNFIYTILALNFLSYFLGILIYINFKDFFDFRWFEISLFIQSLSWLLLAIRKNLSTIVILVNIPLTSIFIIYFAVALLWAYAKHNNINKILKILPESIDLPSSLISIILAVIIKSMLTYILIY
ncbi:MAG: hypothetical protein QW607_00720 [Desulfurococcaceae archaeon]